MKVTSPNREYHIVTTTVTRDLVAIVCEDKLAQRVMLKEFGAMASPHPKI